MIVFHSPLELKSAIAGLLISSAASLPAYVQTNLRNIQYETSAVPIIVNTMEALYAAKDDLPDEAKLICGQCADMVFQTDWFGKTDRAFAIFQVMRRLLGESEGPDPETDPAPEDPWKAPPAPPEEPEE